MKKTWEYINAKIIPGIIKSIKPRTIAIERVSIKRIGLTPLKRLNIVVNSHSPLL